MPILIEIMYIILYSIKLLFFLNDLYRLKATVFPEPMNYLNKKFEIFNLKVLRIDHKNNVFAFRL